MNIKFIDNVIKKEDRIKLIDFLRVLKNKDKTMSLIIEH